MLKLLAVCIGIGLVVGILTGLTGVHGTWVGLLTGGLCGILAGISAGRGWLNTPKS